MGDNNSLVSSRQPKTRALTSSNGTGTVVATDDGCLNGVVLVEGPETRFGRQMICRLRCIRTSVMEMMMRGKR